jgi:hypothetical protein
MPFPPEPHYANRAASVWRMTIYVFTVIKSAILSFPSIAATIAICPKLARLLREPPRTRKLQVLS